jgi:hypothetical protein
MLRSHYGNALIRAKGSLSKSLDSILMMLILAHTRNHAHCLRKKVVKINGRKVINRQVKDSIKAYSKRRFGSKSYWPYLAYYTEIRGKFVEGWIPHDYFRFTFVPRLNPMPARAMDFKTLDYQLFKDFAVRPLYLYIHGMYYDADLKFISPDQAISHLSEYEDDIVIKGESGWGGLQVRVVHSSQFTPELLKEGFNYVIQPYVKQHPILNEVYPDSVNTLRVNTFLKKDGIVSVKCVWLRFGADGSKVDNITSGGNFLYFDLSGRPENRIYEPDLGYELADRHKNTAYPFSELRIPMFDEVLEKCKNAHLKFPYVRLVAWDVCIDHTGEPKLIEWNTTNPDFISVSAKWGPYWIDDSEI